MLKRASPIKKTSVCITELVRLKPNHQRDWVSRGGAIGKYEGRAFQMGLSSNTGDPESRPSDEDLESQHLRGLK